MPSIVLHPLTEDQLNAFIAHPGHALLLAGPSGIGKTTVSRWVTAQLTQKDAQTLDEQPYVRIVVPDKPHSISIEAVRNLEQFLRLKIAGDAQRVIIIDEAHLLTEQAQNALLKTVEEPPERTTIILNANNELALLPTIRSRVHTITVKRPPAKDLTAHFTSLGHDEKQIRQAHLIGGDLPGLMTALLTGDTEHPLLQAATTARQILQANTFERLAMVDVLAKQREHTIDVLHILQQMAHISLAAVGKSAAAVQTWQQVLRTSYDAAGQLQENAQAKLVLTNLMLNL